MSEATTRSTRKGPSGTLSALAVGALVLAGTARAQQPLSLDEAVRVALDHNPALRASAEEAEAARSRLDQAKAARYPRLDLSQGFTRGNNPVYAFSSLLLQQRFTAAHFALPGLNAPAPIDNLQTRLEGRMLLFDSRRTALRVSGAEALLSAARLETEQERQDLILRVVRTYYAVVVSREHLAAATETLRSAEANERRIRTMVEAGEVVPSDLLSAQVQRAQMRERVIRAQNALDLARLALGHEMGLGTDALREPTGALAEPAGSPLSVDDWERTALEERPALLAAERHRRAAEAGRRRSRAEFGPTVDVFADIERDAEGPGGPSGTHWTAGARLNLNLFAGGANRHHAAETRARERQASDRLESLRSSVRLETRQAYLETIAARHRAEAARDAVEQARESLRIVQNRYETSLTTITELLRAQAARLEAQTTYLSALHDAQVARAQLERAAGRLTHASELIRGGARP
ncbi:MAG TPA: TolC family protein [Candidatus Polarisedimenticolaceae bacterium]